MARVIDMPVPAKKAGLMERLVFRGVVFNMSWEDPEMDRRAFRIVPDQDTVISITSAGCNPLNFLCQGAKRLYCVDGNYAQNALLEIKLAAIETCDHQTFFDIFSAQRPLVVTKVYRTRLRPEMSARSKEYWDRNLWQLARNLYDYGWMGLFCRLLRGFLSLRHLPAWRREQFFEMPTLGQQQRFYDRHIAAHLWGPWTRRFIKCKPLMIMAGVHDEQFKLVNGRHDIYDYVKERVEYALTQVPIYDNYFLSAAITGRMRGRRVPPYLLEQNFATLRKNLDRVTVVTGWLDRFLDTLPEGSIDKFNLLDIFDWMAPAGVEQTWRSVLRAASPRATMIYRSGSYQFDPPEFVREQLVHHAALAKELLAIDRSATYGSFYVFSRPGVDGRGLDGGVLGAPLAPAAMTAGGSRHGH
jgi:S-adenosylmethionine-diacylglycerol 3-amino-3-carboxypropyl transferase